MLLALETSTDVCSVAFMDDDGNLFEKRIEKRGSHSEKLFLFIEEFMEERGFKIPELQTMLISQGPGSYTGLRIGASAVKGLLFDTEIPLYAVNTLAGFAQSVIVEGVESNTIHSVIDARRVHLYHQKFVIKNQKIEALSEVEILPIETIQQTIEAGDVVIGTGIGRLDQLLFSDVAFLGADLISARSLISLYDKGDSPLVTQVDPERFDPKYYTSRQVDK